VLHRRRRRANGLPPFSQGLRLSILVTGGAGFVATTLIARLLERGETVLAVDNMSRGSAANLGALQRNPRLKIVVADIADLPSFRAALRAHSRLGPITASWHLAANSDIPAGIANANVDLKDTFLTTFNTLQVMEEHGVREIFFASSSAIYGDLGDTVLTENVGPLFPISNYGAMKLASEALVTAAAEKFLARAILFRFPNVVGVPATHGVLLDFIRRLKADRRQLQVLGDGTQQKSYLHVSDLVDAMLFVEQHSKARINAINIGPTDEGITVRRIAEETIAHLAPQATLKFGEGNKGWVGDVPRFAYSTARVQSLGWRPRLNSLGAIRRSIREIAAQEAAL
jgi:UDP-glucose 4-epimerase